MPGDRVSETLKSTVNNGVLPVWDLGVRLFHWLTVACVVVAATTGFLLEGNWLNWHIAAGASLAVLIALRLIWGFTGSSYSRFKNLTLSLGAALNHLSEIRTGIVHREGGHNAFGSWMVLALIASLIGLVLSGLALLGGMLKQGPGKSFLSFDVGVFMREPHEILAYGLLALIVLHLGGVWFETRRSGENLTRAMLTGNKTVGFKPARHLTAARPARAIALATVTLGIAVSGIVFLNALPAKGVKAVAADPIWAKECGECHMTFHPTLLPAQSWKDIMQHLDDHFGEDAGTSVENVAAISAYLTSNSAETSDGLVGNVFRLVSPTRPLEITQTPFWTRRHEKIADSIFNMPQIKSKHNCAACHTDTVTGAFAPQNISIPVETAL
jgi:cytochrome b